MVNNIKTADFTCFHILVQEHTSINHALVQISTMVKHSLVQGHTRVYHLWVQGSTLVNHSLAQGHTRVNHSFQYSILFITVYKQVRLLLLLLHFQVQAGGSSVDAWVTLRPFYTSKCAFNCFTKQNGNVRKM